MDIRLTTLGAFNNTRYKVTDDEDFGAALYLAQHHGFPTPLLDWTISPFVASCFWIKEKSMMRIFFLIVLAFTLSGCATSATQTEYIDAGGHDCVKTLKKVGLLGIPVSESVECSTLIKTSVNQPYKATFQASRKKHWFFLWLF
jgi:predicted small secreted protein